MLHSYFYSNDLQISKTPKKEQVCENNWIRRIAGVRRVERWRMKDLWEGVRTKACTVGKIIKSRMKWAGHIHGQNEI